MQKSHYQRVRSSEWAQLFVVYLRYLIGGAYIFASVVKIKGERFTTADGSDYPIQSSWHFFETMYQSGLYWQFLGWSQCLAGLLLMTQRFATLGAMAFLPISINIFVITISYNFSGTPFITAGMLLANILLLAWDYPRFGPLWKNPNPPIQLPTIRHQTWWEGLGLILFGWTIGLTYFRGRDLIIWLPVCLLLGLGGFIGYVLKKKK
jgi:hypothetical protein